MPEYASIHSLNPKLETAPALRRTLFLLIIHILILVSATATVAQGQISQPATNNQTTTNPISTLPIPPITVQFIPAATTQKSIWLELPQAYGSLVAALVALIVAFIALLKGRVDARYTYASEILKFRLRQIQEFYAPTLLRIEQSNIVYRKLLWTIKEERKDVSLEGFRLLDRIHEFKKNKKLKPLVNRILTIGKEITDLISQKAGLIEGGITPVFTEYQAHFEILKAASEQDSAAAKQEGWQEFGYFPRMLHREVREGYKSILVHLENYVTAGDKIIYKILGGTPIDLGDYRRQLLDNLHYYEQHALAYASKYDKLDMSSIHARFINAIKETVNDQPCSIDVTGIKILDAGCGTGRDTHAFLMQGYAVIAVDPSPTMLRLCRRKITDAQRSENNVTMRDAALSSATYEMTFDEIAFYNEFDGIWAAASILHVPSNRMERTIRKLFQGLKLNGILYMSFKHGTGERRHDARCFCYLNKRTMEKYLSSIPEAVLIDVWLTNRDGKTVSPITEWFVWQFERFGVYNRNYWLNVIVKRRRIPF